MIVYTPRKAARGLKCVDGDHFPDCPQLKMEVWREAAGIDGVPCMLCMPCTERRLGRELRVEDLADCPANAFPIIVAGRVR